MRFTRQETQDGIGHHGKLQLHEAEARESKGDVDGAKACRERASTAEAGFLLDRGDVEARDPNYAIPHQELRENAYHYDLVVNKPMALKKDGA